MSHCEWLPLSGRKLLVALVVCIAEWSCAAQHAAKRDISCNPFKQVTNTAARIPSATASMSSDGVRLLGYVADSATGNALSGAIVFLMRYRGNVAIDTTVAYSDSAGGLAIQLPARGRYRYSVLSPNFVSTRDSIDVLTPAETLRVSLRRGLPLCDVRMTDAPHLGN